VNYGKVFPRWEEAISSSKVLLMNDANEKAGVGYE
jgi:hypothetical protein